MAADAFLDEVEHRFEVVGGQAHRQMGHQSLQHQLQIRGQHLDTDVVAEVPGLTLPGEPLAGGGGQLLGPLRPARAELRVGAEPAGDLQPRAELVRRVLAAFGEQITHHLDETLLGDDVGHPHRVVLGEGEEE